jgi:hypothetical protein
MVAPTDRHHVRAGRRPGPRPEVVLDDPGEQHPRRPDAEADQDAAADQRGRDRHAAHGAAQRHQPDRAAECGFAAEPGPEDRPDERPERHHQHRAGLHQPGGPRVDAEVGADRLQQRGYAASAARRLTASASMPSSTTAGRTRRSGAASALRGGTGDVLMSPTFARRAAVGWSQLIVREVSAR